MKKYFSLFLFILFGVLTVLIIRYRKPTIKYTVIERSSSDGEWLNTKQAIENLLSAVRTNPADQKSKLKLAYAYIQEGRTSGNHAYYDPATLSLCEEILNTEPANYEALCAKATVLLSQHHFSDVKPIAEKAIQLNPYNSTGYGILTDCYVELGQYNEAISTADMMASIRPDIRSYSRVSYLREIMGDVNGAINAMKLAVSCGYPGYEQTEWTRCQLGHLYESTGQQQEAQLQYRIALDERPNYAFAYSGLGRIEKANGNYPKAIKYLQQARTLLNDFSFDQELTELYLLNGEAGKSSQSGWETIEALAGLTGTESQKNHGHYADRELAYAYLNVYRYDLALAHALTEYNRRPENIDVSQTVAWVYYKRGQYEKAQPYINSALRTHSKNPVLLYQAGLIKKATGKIAEGDQLLGDAIHANPFLSSMLKRENNNNRLAMK